MTLDGREVTDASGSVHLTDEAVAYLWNQPRTIFVLPIFERPSRLDLKRIEKWPVYEHVVGSKVSHVDVDPASSQPYSRATQNHRFTRDLGLDDRQSLRQRMVRELRCGGGPQQISEIVACELLAWLQGQTHEQREVFARAEPYLLARDGEQGRSPKAAQPEGMSHRQTAFY